ncbi:MAG TPA: alkaline phosphatase family protein [Verrucomicrobiae bacterium]|nr:alkaline phosphatase family protein [Verrucomicrobiae bacterium]
MKVVVCRLALALTALFVAAYCGGQTAAPNTPLQHIIVVVQENRTPDNLFLADQNLIRRGAHLEGSGYCRNTRIPLTPWRLDACFNPSHAHKGGWLPTYDGGKMDGACSIPPGLSSGCAVPACPNSAYAYCPEYTYVQNATYDGVHGILDPYFQLAEDYGFANYMFQTNQGPSFPAHQFLFSGTSAPEAYPGFYYQWFAAENLVGGSANGCIAAAGNYVSQVSPTGNESKGYAPPVPSGATQGYPCYEHRTMSDLLNGAGISWRYYTSGQGSLWTAPNAINHICQSSGFGGSCEGPAFKNGHVVSKVGKILTDLGVNGTSTAACQLPKVSWVIPDGAWSDHPGTVGSDGGPSWVAAIVNAVGGYDNAGNKLPIQCNYWNNTALLITWDDWGGFYDDVDPIKTIGQGNAGYPNGGGNGESYVYGFRVPLIVVSPYAKAGYISGPPNNPVCPSYYCHDFGSILNFIEYAFGTNGNPIGTVGPEQWPYADFFAQDASFGPQHYSLHDFFEFNFPRPFFPVRGAKYATSCFLNPKSCFATFPEAADSD